MNLTTILVSLMISNQAALYLKNIGLFFCTYDIYYKNQWQRNQIKNLHLILKRFIKKLRKSARVLFLKKERAIIKNQSTIKNHIKAKEDEKTIT